MQIENFPCGECPAIWSVFKERLAHKGQQLAVCVGCEPLTRSSSARNSRGSIWQSGEQRMVRKGDENGQEGGRTAAVQIREHTPKYRLLCR